MPDTTWIERYASLTIGGLTWESDESLDTLIAGRVLDVDGWHDVNWIVLADGTLHSPANRAHNVLQIELPPPPPEVRSVTRELDVNFVIDADRQATVIYNIDLFVEALVVGLHTNSASVVLLVDGSPADEVSHILVATIVLGSGLQPTMRKSVSATVPAGSTVQLASVTQGTGVATFVSGQETFL